MKRHHFDVPGSLWIERAINREGPPVQYTVWQKNSSRFYGTKAEVLKAIKWPKSLPTGEAVREWLDQFDDDALTKPEHDGARIKAEGFGPEAHADEPDPTSNTKMIT